VIIEADKMQHLIGGMALALYGAALTLLPWWAAGLALAAAGGIGKEVWDKLTGRGTPEVMDAVATVLGGLVLIVIVSAAL
jgi:drug/metabolite transporter superfamily protein YnfA